MAVRAHVRFRHPGRVHLPRAPDFFLIPRIDPLAAAGRSVSEIFSLRCRRHAPLACLSRQCTGFSGGAGFGCGAVVACAMILGGLHWYKKKQALKAGGGTGVDAVQVQVTASPAATQSAQPPPPSQAPATTALPAGWTEQTDPASGQTYYYHALSQTSSWTFPTA